MGYNFSMHDNNVPNKNLDLEKGRKGNWIQTFSGQMFWPLDPRPEEIFTHDIAHALSLICRYAGHCREFYSVAQHCVIGTHLVPRHLALDFLFHDASEAYISDLPKPVKVHLADYKEIEATIEAAIAERYGLQDPHPPEIKTMDWTLLATEARDLMEIPRMAWYIPEGIRALDYVIKPWKPSKAESLFHRHFEVLTSKAYAEGKVSLDIFHDQVFI